MGPWEDALDVDDSDLPSFLRPCKRRHSDCIDGDALHSQEQHSNHSFLHPSSDYSSSPPTPSTPFQSQPHPLPQFTASSSAPCIPGPAGAVQAAMLRRKACVDQNIARGDPPIPTQEFIRKAVEEVRDDDDFRCNPYLCALEFLGIEGGGLPSTPLCSIKKCLNVGRVDQVVAIIKSCKPNGLGDLMVTLKDPTGTINGSIHHEVLAEVKFGKEISVGSVLILQKVAVFAPSRSAHYLNITLRNIIKVISKDNGHLQKQNHTVAAIKSIGVGSECGREAGNVQEAFSLEIDRTEGVQMEAMLAKQEEIIKGTLRLETVDDEESGSNAVKKLQKEGHSSSSVQHASSAFNTVENDENEEIQRANGVGKQRQPLISRASIPAWTDEQLNELFATDCDDDGSLF